MKEFIDKLNEKLTYLLNHFGEHCEEWGSDKEGDCHRKSCSDCVLTHAIEKVNQLAEEYKVSEMPTGWISVSERLPKEDEIILCLHSDGFIDCGVLVGETWCCDMDEYSVIRDDIHAWMPLPAPYTEGE